MREYEEMSRQLMETRDVLKEELMKALGPHHRASSPTSGEEEI